MVAPSRMAVNASVPSSASATTWPGTMAVATQAPGTDQRSLPACVQSSRESMRATATPSTATEYAVTSAPPSAKTASLPFTGFALLGARCVAPGTRTSHASENGSACTAPRGSGVSLVRLPSAS